MKNLKILLILIPSLLLLPIAFDNEVKADEPINDRPIIDVDDTEIPIGGDGIPNETEGVEGGGVVTGDDEEAEEAEVEAEGDNEASAEEAGVGTEGDDEASAEEAGVGTEGDDEASAEEAGVGTGQDVGVEVNPETGNVEVTGETGGREAVEVEINPETGEIETEIEDEVVVERGLGGLDGVLREQFPGVFNYVESILGPFNLSQIPSVIKQIDNLGEIFNQSGTQPTDVGVLGLPNPQEEANRTATSGKYSNPQTVKGVDELSQASDAVQSQILQNLSQIVFGETGQENVLEQNEYLEESQDVSLNSLNSSIESLTTSIEISENQTNLSAAIATEAENARQANASQDVLKALATQKEYQAQMEAGIGEQLTLLSGATVANAAQMQGLNTQLSVLNRREENMQTFLGAQNLQLTEIDSNLEQEIAFDKHKTQQDAIEKRVRSTLLLFGVFDNETDQDI